uniref:Preprotein-translocase subunit g n=1 Tax=Dipterosiphonia australica TaxID=2007208 RepID=A0A1Z1MM72_9FLOR|nr:preprotein-translocase subunit g [Dipterosiphonia australica]ARW66851.1 preprotein-translocase subunit g [Dipterosiphonia australica]
MLIKVFWYFFSLLSIFFILINVPSKSNIKSSVSQGQLFGLRSNRLFIEKVIAFNVSMFFILTILSLI